jgi:flagellar assembly protein FliH
MNMSSSSEAENIFTFPIAALEYRNIAGNALSEDGIADGKRRAEIELTEEEFADRILRERAEATVQIEQRLRQEFETKLEIARQPIPAALDAFEIQRNDYYGRVEAEVVQLALSIAAKILHRESQVDPMLVAALVRLAIEKLREGSSVTIRIAPRQSARWNQYFASHPMLHAVQIAEDPSLNEFDCMLETELGVTNFGLDTQLKEVERGFFDLLALRPAK